MAGVHLAARACLLSFLLCAAFAQVPSDQVESLEGLYNATNGDGWTDNTNWNTGDPCDNSWFGVVCTGDNITEVNLGGNGLTGTLPASLDLPELLILDLSDNMIGGSVLEYDNLTSLTVFDLSNNALCGPLPDQPPTSGNVTLDGNTFFCSTPPDYCPDCECDFVEGACSCPEAQFYNASGCFDCEINCQNCTDANTCTACNSSSATPLLENGDCVSACADGNYEDGDICSPCSVDCFTCTETSTNCTSCDCAIQCQTCEGTASNCTACASGFPLIEGNTCVSECSPGFFQNGSLCEPCDTNCLTCVGTAENCTS